ncbi:putative ABC transport system ATP-binding protein [Butyrivibrio sp. ob235]|uniref:ABC transporter ATP-binding protein n=1 Tax=Butyrivibrio sp. ob235 TaxID=1761780 RepID=UPI0008B91ABF|nr:ABC transporter ATP-binding protein [Butyrivibrio sp. ob235]SEL70480.1 putative ABC transport system ATP-binding protein [Butyrivibrio sp. ob235]
MEKILKVKNLRKGAILNGISFEVLPGELIAIMGPSGSGKSTLLYSVSGMDTVDGGEISFCGKNVEALSEDERAELRLNHMGFVFQQMNSLSNLNIEDNIVFPAVHSDKKKSNAHYEKARLLMEKFHIEDLAMRRVNEVSGGQLQRACICRSMIMEPEIIFADEPTGALNQSASAEVMDAFLKANQDGTTILMVTHDSKVAGICDRILYILDGEIKGELKLGKYKAENRKEREQETAVWLESMGW